MWNSFKTESTRLIKGTWGDIKSVWAVYPNVVILFGLAWLVALFI
jgi:hypothetical protein